MLNLSCPLERDLLGTQQNAGASTTSSALYRSEYIGANSKYLCEAFSHPRGNGGTALGQRDRVETTPGGGRERELGQSPSQTLAAQGAFIEGAVVVVHFLSVNQLPKNEKGNNCVPAISASLRVSCRRLCAV